jgi:hypothetical protein
MKFSFLVSLRVTTDSFVRVDSPLKLPIQKFPTFYTWNPSGLALDGYGMDDDSRLQLEFVLSCETGNILAKRVEITAGELNYNTIGEGRYPVLKKGDVEMSYNAIKYMENNKTLGRIIISVVSLMEFNPQKVIEENKRGHKVTCKLGDVYLGRAQECITLEDDKRFYYWYPTLEEQSSFEGLSPREDLNQVKEEDSDIALIKMACPSGFEPRKSSIEVFSYVSDNDGFHNQNRRLPLFIERGSKRSQKLSIYNFKFTPPKCVDVNLIWSDFAVTKHYIKQPSAITKWGFRRRSTPLNTSKDIVQMGFVEYPLIKDMKIEIFFEKVSEDKVKLTSLQLKVIKDFEKVLEMDEIQKAITI